MSRRTKSTRTLDPRLQLDLFSEKAGLLENSRFLAWLTGGPKHPDYAKINAGDWLAYSGLHPDDLHAFGLNLRLLIQPGDKHSIYDMPGHYAVLGVSEAERLANEELAQLRAYLAEESLVQLSRAGPRTTNWDLFEILFYGGLVHSNDDKVATYRRLTREGIVGVFTFSAFGGTVLRYMNCIRKLAAMNGVILQRTETKPTTGV